MKPLILVTTGAQDTEARRLSQERDVAALEQADANVVTVAELDPVPGRSLFSAFVGAASRTPAPGR